VGKERGKERRKKDDRHKGHSLYRRCLFTPESSSSSRARHPYALWKKKGRERDGESMWCRIDGGERQFPLLISPFTNCGGLRRDEGSTKKGAPLLTLTIGS